MKILREFSSRSLNLTQIFSTISQLSQHEIHLKVEEIMCAASKLKRRQANERENS